VHLRLRPNQTQRDKLVTENLCLARWVAWKYRKGTVAYRELEAIALEALVRAANTWDPRSGFAFSTWATNTIRWAIQKALKGEPYEVISKNYWGTDDEDGPVLGSLYNHYGRQYVAGVYQIPEQDKPIRGEFYEWQVWDEDAYIAAVADYWKKLAATWEDSKEREPSWKKEVDVLEELDALYEMVADRIIDLRHIASEARPLMRMFVAGLNLEWIARESRTSYYRTGDLLRKALIKLGAKPLVAANTSKVRLRKFGAVKIGPLFGLNKTQLSDLARSPPRTCQHASMVTNLGGSWIEFWPAIQLH